MEHVSWFVLACIVVTGAAYIYIESKVSSYRERRKRRERLPDAPIPLVAGRWYRIRVGESDHLDRVYIVGMAYDPESPLPHLQVWLVAQKPDGKMIYLLPQYILYVEDA